MLIDGHQLGIDFGTSNTVAVLDGRPLLFDSSPLLASGVFAGRSGLLTGVDAERAAVASPAGLEANPKRRLNDGTVFLGDREITVVELVEAVLRRVVAEAVRVTGGPVTRAVLTHPAGWGRARMRVLTEAAARVGLTDVILIPEPVAAAAYLSGVLSRRLASDKPLVVYDLGAGTFDVSVVRGGTEVVGTAGLGDVGGLDLDAVVVEHARAQTVSHVDGWRRLDAPRTPAEVQARFALWRGARAAKEQLSRHVAADLHVPLVEADVRLTREEFERLALPYLERTVQLTSALLRDRGIAPADLGGVFLVGGSSRIPLVATLLHRALGVAPTVIAHPELVVAEGTAVAAPAPTARSVESPPGSAGTPEKARRSRTPLLVGCLAALLVVGVVAALALRPSTHTRLKAGPSPAAGSAVPSKAAVAATLVSRRLTGHTDIVAGVAVSLDDKTVYTGSHDNTIRVWDATTGISERTLTGHSDGISALALSKDGHTLASASYDGTVKLWDLSTFTVARTLHVTTITGGVWALAYSPDGTMLATGDSDHAVKLWNSATGTLLRTISDGDGDGDVWSVRFSPDSHTVLAGTDDGAATLFTVSTGKKVRTFTGDESADYTYDDVAFSHDGKTVAFANESGTVQLVSTATGAVQRTLSAKPNGSLTVDVSPDGTLLATATTDGNVGLWSMATGTLVKKLGGFSEALRTVRFSADGTVVVAGSTENDAQVWPVPGDLAGSAASGGASTIP